LGCVLQPDEIDVNGGLKTASRPTHRKLFRGLLACRRQSWRAGGEAGWRSETDEGLSHERFDKNASCSATIPGRGEASQKLAELFLLRLFKDASPVRQFVGWVAFFNPTK